MKAALHVPDQLCRELPGPAARLRESIGSLVEVEELVANALDVRL